MSLANTQLYYGSVAKTFHWVTALLVVTLIPLGIYANGLPYDTSEHLADKAWFFSLHKTLGVTVFFVASARILWAISQAKPAHLHPDRKIETLAAATVHWLLYGSLILVPISGWIHHAATTGYAPIWWPFGQGLPFIPKSESIAAATAGLHIVFERVLAISIFLHVAGALKHQFFDRDATLRRMLPGTPQIDAPNASQRNFAPLVVALAIWGAALAVGASLDIYASHGDDKKAAALEAVPSDWVVQEGAINFTVTQLGSAVTGSFSDFTVAIRFDENVKAGRAGSVDVVISIGSLSLGSVTQEAMKADFFNAVDFPMATFKAEILRSSEGYLAKGPLTIKETSVEIALPFTLEVVEGIATMEAVLPLDRRSFAIGASQQDEATLGFAVDVSIKLTAQDQE